MLVALVLPAYSAPRRGLDFGGSMYSDLGVNHTYHPDTGDDFAFRGLSTLELNLENRNQRHGKVEGSTDILVPYGGFLEQSYGGGALSMLDTLGVVLDRAPVLFDLRKLYLSAYLPFADITIGRQIVNFGKGRLFSPIDAFSSVEVADINLRRRGSDIVMARIPLGMLAGADAVVELPFADRTYSAALKVFGTIKNWDVSVVGIYRNAGEDSGGEDEGVVGAAFKGDIEIGVHGEAVSTFTDVFAQPSWEVMLGADYSFNDRVFVLAEYLYQQERKPESPWGEHNAFGSVRLTINDLMNVSGTVIHNFEDDLTIGTLQYSYNILQNVNTIAYIRGYRGSPLHDLEYAVRVEVVF